MTTISRDAIRPLAAVHRNVRGVARLVMTVQAVTLRRLAMTGPGGTLLQVVTISRWRATPRVMTSRKIAATSPAHVTLRVPAEMLLPGETHRRRAMIGRATTTSLAHVTPLVLAETLRPAGIPRRGGTTGRGVRK